ncbi:MAG: hypothetical protein PHC95_05005 [Parabacteroides sp.]|nr:hypothetical protein [Parabacteroides sp.]
MLLKLLVTVLSTDEFYICNKKDKLIEELSGDPKVVLEKYKNKEVLKITPLQNSLEIMLNI